MDQEGIVKAEGCPHYITVRYLAAWTSRFGDKPSLCRGCSVDGFVPSPFLRATRRRSYDVEHVNRDAA